MVVSAVIKAFGDVINEWIGDYSNWLVLFDYVVINFIVLTLLFAFMFRFMPDVRLKWGETWFGAIFTAILFIAGKSLIGIFIGNSQTANFYDAAGSILVLMLWIYYSSAIFLFGAIFTNSRAKLLNGKTETHTSGRNFIWRITADTTWRLSSYFGNSAKFWPGLQDDYNNEYERQKI